MPSARWNEERRLVELESYKIFDTGPEERFDCLARTAAKALGMPIALISLVDRDRQWRKSSMRLPDVPIPRSLSFSRCCAQTIEPLIIPDAQRHPRFARHPLVSGAPFLRAYIGAPLVTSTGWGLGALNLWDPKPRAFTERQILVVQDVARLIMDQIELGRTHHDAPLMESAA